MTKSLKIIIGIALALVIAGAVLTLVAFAVTGFDAGRIGTGKMETKTYPITETVEQVGINVQTADVTFFVAEDGEARVECYEDEKQPHTVALESGRLTVNGTDQRKWYERISIVSKTPKIKVYLPAGEYAALDLETDTGDVNVPETVTFGTMKIKTDTGDVTLAGGSPATVNIETDTGDVVFSSSTPGAVGIETDTGDIKLNGVSCGDLSVESDTGKVKMTDVSCAALTVETNTGDVVLKNVVGTGDAKIETDTGDVEFDRCDAANYEIRTATGDVEGTIRTGKLYTVSSRTGDVKVPEHDPAGGAFKATTHTGDVKIRIQE